MLCCGCRGAPQEAQLCVPPGGPARGAGGRGHGLRVHRCRDSIPRPPAQAQHQRSPSSSSLVSLNISNMQTLAPQGMAVRTYEFTGLLGRHRHLCCW